MIGWHHEERARALGYTLIGGLDEAGRGPLAGPVVAACVILPFNSTFVRGLRDSKMLSPKQRQHWYETIHQHAVGIGVGTVDAFTIDSINILQATFLAMRQAHAQLSPAPDYRLVDGNLAPAWAAPAEAIVRGDQTSYTIAAASVVAKVVRDRLMREFSEQYPHWGFDQHKGYGTVEHLEAIRRHGVCRLHRRSFAPVRTLQLEGDLP